MEKFNRSVRRAQYRRVLAKRLHEERWVNHGVMFGIAHSDSLRFARLRTSTGKNCSCLGCGSPRKYQGNAWTAKTRQELVALDRLRYVD